MKGKSGIIQGLIGVILYGSFLIPVLFFDFAFRKIHVTTTRDNLIFASMGGLGLALLAWYWDKGITLLKIKGRTQEKVESALAFVIIGIFFVVVYGGVLNLRWMEIDDHEIVVLLGEDSRMEMSEVFEAFSQTEIHYFGVLTRFRPVYWLGRILEVVLFGGHLSRWYLARLMTFIILCWWLWIAFKRVIGFVLSGLLVIHFFSYSFWVDIIARLGPSETYVAVGIVIFFFGFFRLMDDILKCTPTKPMDWLLVSTGTMICVGSKENMVILVVFISYLIYRAWGERSRRIVVLSWVFSLGWIGFVLAAIALSTTSFGMDIHGDSTRWTERLSLGVRFFSQLPALTILASTLILLLCLPLFKKVLSHLVEQNGIDFEKASTIRSFLIWQGGLLFLTASQYIFYAGRFPENNRYAFPGMLFLPLMLLGSNWLIQAIFPVDNFPGLQRSGMAIQASIILYVLFCNGFFPAR